MRRFRHFEGLHRALRDVGSVANTLKFPAKRFQALPFAHSQVLPPLLHLLDQLERSRLTMQDCLCMSSRLM